MYCRDKEKWYSTYLIPMSKYMFVCVAICIISAETLANGDELLHSSWSELLGAHVNNGVVDYLGMKKDEKKLDAYLDGLDAANPDSFRREDRLALYINAYNAYTVKLILDNFKDGKPVSSIKKLGGFFTGPWKVDFCRIGGELLSLDNIEHDIIRPLFKDPRVHFAINCAAKSCPPLISTAYEGILLNEQLDRNAVAFINNKNYNYLNGTTLHVSKIFKWFSEDFGDDIAGFFKKTARGELKRELETLESFQISFLAYDWSLNAE